MVVSAAAPLISSSPARAHVALIQIDAELADFLRLCLLQMSIEALPVDQLPDLAKRKFEGCIVDLRHDDAAAGRVAGRPLSGGRPVAR